MEPRPTYFRVNAVLPLAIERREGEDHPPPPALVIGRSLASEARDANIIIDMLAPRPKTYLPTEIVYRLNSSPPLPRTTFSKNS